jgi:hypothetical protein
LIEDAKQRTGTGGEGRREYRNRQLCDEAQQDSRYRQSRQGDRQEVHRHAGERHHAEQGRGDWRGRQRRPNRGGQRRRPPAGSHGAFTPSHGNDGSRQRGT